VNSYIHESFITVHQDVTLDRCLPLGQGVLHSSWRHKHILGHIFAKRAWRTSWAGYKSNESDHEDHSRRVPGIVVRECSRDEEAIRHLRPAIDSRVKKGCKKKKGTAAHATYYFETEPKSFEPTLESRTGTSNPNNHIHRRIPLCLKSPGRMAFILVHLCMANANVRGSPPVSSHHQMPTTQFQYPILVGMKTTVANHP